MKLRQSPEHSDVIFSVDQNEQQKTLFRVIADIRESLDIDTIFHNTVAEVRQLLNTERFGVLRFDSDGEWTGKFLYEDVGADWDTLLGVKLDDQYFAELGELYQQSRVKAAINDVVYINGLADSCSIELYTKFQVRTSIAVPVFKSQNLWGLLCIHHCSDSRQWELSEIEFVQLIAEHLGLALQQADYIEQAKSQSMQLAQAKARENAAEWQKTITKTIEKMAGLGQLVAGVAHEINNPISFIYGNIYYVTEYTEDLLELIRLYQQNYPQPVGDVLEHQDALDLDFIADDLPKLLNSMMIGANRIRELVLSLRTFSRLDEAQMKPVDVHQGIDSTLLILQNRLQLKDTQSIQIIREYGELPHVPCYAAQLNQVFLNIITNAIDAIEMAIQNGTMNQHPRIWIRTNLSPENFIQICIADNGCGITENMRSRVFEPFFTNKEPGKGIGLGLSISYQIIVEKHNGKIKCISEHERGCEFWIEIPLK